MPHCDRKAIRLTITITITITIKTGRDQDHDYDDDQDRKTIRITMSTVISIQAGSEPRKQAVTHESQIACPSTLSVTAFRS